MEIITFNDDNLEKEKTNEKTIKVRAILVNDENEILLANYGGVYLLPGGTLEQGEAIPKTLTRELKEELGINVILENREPDFLVEQLIKNYPKRNNKGSTDRLMITYYYLIYTNEIKKTNSASLTEDEINDNFSVFSISISNIYDLISKNQTDNPRNKYFSRELLVIIEKLQQTLNNGTSPKRKILSSGNESW